MKSLLKIIMIPFGFLFGLINFLPIPWKIRLRWGYYIRLMVVKIMGIFPFFVQYQQGVNIQYKMGKQKEDGDIKSLKDFENLIRYFDINKIPVDRVKEAVKHLDEDRVDMSDYTLKLAKKVLGEQEGQNVYKNLHKVVPQ